ncbi:MAG: chromate efflux transporter [Ignavibacteriae bacterium]|nr:chromate efflux transporter [Ignavibacteriota bacterium]
MPQVTLFELAKYFLILGATGFGGPLAIIEKIRFDLVLKKNWMQMEEFKDLFGYAQVAPGPLAFQVAVYFGYYRKGFWGAVAAGFGLVFPSFLLVLIFSIFYKEFRDVDYIRYALYGLSPVIIAIIAKSGLNLSKTIFRKDIFMYVVFFLSVFFTIVFKIQIIYIVLAFAIVSLLYHLILKKIKGDKLNSFLGFIPLLFSAFFAPAVAGFANFVKNTVSLCVKSFSAILISSLFSANLLALALLFLKVGSLTYGSGFVIVGVLKQEVVDNLHWLTSKEFIDGIAFGQITPGPVVITSTFIGYMTSGVIGSIVSTACIFLPTFVFVLILAQKIHKFKDNFYLQSLIKGANAAALGAIISTAFILSKDALIDIPTIVLFLVSLGILFSTKFKDIYLILLSAAAGIAIKLFLFI